MDFDQTLDALSRSEAPPALDRLEARVFGQIDAEAHGSRGARRGTLAIVAAATLVGVAGAAIPARPSAAAPMPLTAGALAPSTLLGGEP